jgi:hypothetical protein
MQRSSLTCALAQDRHGAGDPAQFHPGTPAGATRPGLQRQSSDARVNAGQVQYLLR